MQTTQKNFHKKLLGRVGERLAEKHLKSIGYQILEKNFTTTFGEIDIIAKIGETYAFIEVKRRSSTRYGRPSEAVNIPKMRKIVRAATMYAARRGLSDSPIRFDIIELLPGEINHIPAAFNASDIY